MLKELKEEVVEKLQSVAAPVVKKVKSMVNPVAKKTEKAVYYGKSTFDTLYGNRIPSAYFDWNTVFICTGNPVGRYRSRPDQSNSSG